MQALITALAFIVILGVLVLVHEMGHFLTARLFKVRVEEFGLGFPPRIYPSRAIAERKRAAGKTVYSLNALPLGGFVRLAGENGIAPSGAESGAVPAIALGGRMAQADDPGAFANKPAWQRALILVAGCVSNILLAMALVFFMLAVIGTPHTNVEVIGVELGSPAQGAGLQPGDVIQRVDGKKVENALDIRAVIQAHAGSSVQLDVLRGRQDVGVSLVPRTSVRCGEGPMGIETGQTDAHNVPVPPGQAAATALNLPLTVLGAIASLSTGAGLAPSGGTVCSEPVWYVTFNGQRLDGTSLQRAYTAKNVLREDICQPTQVSGLGIAGPIGIIRQIGCEANAVSKQGWVPLLTLVVELSATLAVMNLLPIPALDGGRLLFVLISVVARKRVRPEVEALAHAVGMVALLSLIMLISFHDLWNWVLNKPAF